MPTEGKNTKIGKLGVSREEAVYLGIQKTAEELKAGLNELFKPQDLTLAQYNVLRILRDANVRGASCSEIGARLVTKDSDITRMLDRMGARELVRRERQNDDRRVIRTFIAEKGLTLLEALDTPVSKLHKSQLANLSKKDLERLAKLLKKATRPPANLDHLS